VYLTRLGVHLTGWSDQLTDRGVYRTDLGDHPTGAPVDNNKSAGVTGLAYRFVIVWTHLLRSLALDERVCASW
jgi:hypothetical protein